MGHLVNPISLRLGRTQIWRSQWYRATNRSYLNTIKEDFTIYSYIESFFKYSKFIKKTVGAVIRQKKKKIKVRLVTKKKNTLLKITVSKKNKKKALKSSNSYILYKKKSKVNKPNTFGFKMNKQILNSNKNKKNLKKKRLRPSQRRRVRIKRYSNSKVIEKLSLIFSHANISRNSSILEILLHIYDGAFEKLKITERENHVNQSFFSRKKVYNYVYKNTEKKTKARKKYLNFKKTKNHYKNIRRSLFKYNRRYRKRRNMIRLLKLNFPSEKYNFSVIKVEMLNRVKKMEQKIFEYKYLSLFSLPKVRNNSKINFNANNINVETLFLKKRLLLIGKKLNFIFNYKNKIKKSIIYRTINKKKVYKRNYFKIVKFLCLLYLKKVYRKKLHNIFLLRLLVYSILKLKNYMKEKLLKKVNITINKNKLNIKIFIFNYLKLHNFLFYIICVSAQYSIMTKRINLYKTRFKTWFYISRILYENIKTILNLKITNNNYNTLKFSYFGLTNATPTAPMLVNYIAKKLYQKYTIFEIIRPLSVDLAKNFTIDGFKISCAGRLSKKQRASLFVQQTKKVPTNTFDSFIDYATNIVRLRHGVCGLKVWVTRKKTYKHFEYNFSFCYNINNI